MLEGIEPDKLPQTLQDTIVFTRKFGKQFIWIDCLFIIQDDDNMEDWKREAKQMASVYSSSCCNMSATASVDSSQGLFRSRNLIPQQKLRVKLGKGNDVHWVHFLASNEWRTEIDESPLNRRGWVCQERYLSSCNLHFGRKQLFWECREFPACELFKHGIYKNYGYVYANCDQKTRVCSALRSRVNLENSNVETKPAYVTWYELVADYTARKLSFENDKSPRRPEHFPRCHLLSFSYLHHSPPCPPQEASQ
jgi:hypothetical protein